MTRKERRERIFKLYKQGTPISLIAYSFDMDRSVIYRMLEKAFKAGKLEKIELPRKVRCDKKDRTEDYRPVQKKQPTQVFKEYYGVKDPETGKAEKLKLDSKYLTECEPIRCTANVKEHCRFGGSCGECNFSSITGKCRSVSNETMNFKGCSPKACIRFQKIDKDHPPYRPRKVEDDAPEKEN